MITSNAFSDLKFAYNSLFIVFMQVIFSIYGQISKHSKIHNIRTASFELTQTKAIFTFFIKTFRATSQI